MTFARIDNTLTAQSRVAADPETVEAGVMANLPLDRGVGIAGSVPALGLAKTSDAGGPIPA